MPAPNSTLLTAFRTANAAPARHMFFELVHSTETVRAWDGIGDFLFGGNVYTGVGGLASISGASNSRDVQNHEIELKLNAIALASLNEPGVYSNVRDDPATLTAVWIEENGNVMASLLVFSGYADFMKVEDISDKPKLVLKLKSKLAEWKSPPRATYTPEFQAKLYAGDTGFKFMKNLENANVSGWSSAAETIDGVPIIEAVLNTATNKSIFFGLFDSKQGRVMGDLTNGMNLGNALGKLATRSPDRTVLYDDDVTGDVAKMLDMVQGAPLTVDGAPAFVSSSVAKSYANNFISRNGASTGRIRAPSPITILGSATANTISAGSFFSDLALPLPYITGSANVPPALNCRGLVFCNRYGLRAGVNGSKISLITGYNGSSFAFGADYVEETTGAAVTFSGGLLKVGASNCTISTTGLVLTPGGRRVILTGFPATTHFLRTFN